jgi:poly(hydroxyalkanoate) depolymerase family esterase
MRAHRRSQACKGSAAPGFTGQLSPVARELSGAAKNICAVQQPNMMNDVQPVQPFRLPTHKEASLRALSDTIRRLSNLHAVSANRQPGGSTLVSFDDFGTNPGALDCKLHVPRSAKPNPPLVVVLHGCTQTAEAYDAGSGWSKLADENGFVVLFPQQRRTNNAQLCFNWFEPEDMTRGKGEAQSIRQMIHSVIERYQIDEQRIFITGLSAGGAMANVMLATSPEVFAAGAIIAGLPYATAVSVPQAFDRMRGHGIPGAAHLQSLLRHASPHQGKWPSISIWHGTADATVSDANARAITQQWMSAHKLHSADSVIEDRAGYALQTWPDGEGRPAISFYTVHGLAHGTPIDAASGYGQPGPFMLDCGVSSTQVIARAWGLLTASEQQAETVGDTDHVRQPRPDFNEPLPASGVQKVIEDALRSAGLLR